VSDVISTEKKLSPAFKARWLEALRSGKYEQGRKMLKGPQGFCCLGVALDVIDSGQWMASGWGNRDDGYELPRYDMSDTSLLSRELGIDGPTCDKLACLNDGITEEERVDEEPARAPLTFAQIADWIEANL